MAGHRDDGTFAEDKAHHPNRKVHREAFIEPDQANPLGMVRPSTNAIPDAHDPGNIGEMNHDARLRPVISDYLDFRGHKLGKWVDELIDSHRLSRDTEPSIHDIESDSPALRRLQSLNQKNEHHGTIKLPVNPNDPEAAQDYKDINNVIYSHGGTTNLIKSAINYRKDKNK